MHVDGIGDALHLQQIGGADHRLHLGVLDSHPLHDGDLFQHAGIGDVDRFMFKVVITYPSVLEEVTVVERMAVQHPEVQPVIGAADLLEMQGIADAVYVHPKLMEYAVTLPSATRRAKDFGLADLVPYISYGSSPRASLNMIIGAKAL